VRLLDLARGAFLAGAGKGAALVAEQLGFDQRFGNRRAIERDKRLLGTRAAVVEGLGEDFLAGAGFALDQDRNVAAKHLAGAVDGELQARVAGVQRVEREWRRRGDRIAAALVAPAERCRAAVDHPAADAEPGQLAAQLQAEDLGPDAYRLMPLRVQAQAVDQRAELGLENQCEVAAQRIDRANSEYPAALGIECLNLAVGGDGGHPLLQAAQILRLFVEADQDVLGMGRLEQPLFDHRRRQAGEAQGVALLGAVIAGNVEHAEQAAIGAEDRAGAAGQEGVVLHEMLGAEHRDRLFLGQRGADGVGAAQVFVPRGAGGEHHPVGAADEIGIADGFQQQAAGVGQDHHAAGFANLLVDVFHHRPAQRQQCPVAFLFGFQRQPVDPVAGGAEAGFAQSETAAALPGAGDQRIDQAPG